MAVRTLSPGAALLLLCTAQLMVLLDTSIVHVALPSIQREFCAAPGRLQWVATAYTLFYGGFLLVGGRLGDRFGRRGTLAAGVWLFTMASAAAGFAPGVGPLIAARALQGLGAALVSPMVFVFVTALHPEGSSRNRVMGILSSMSAVGVISGLILGGMLTEGLGWRSVFFATVPVGLSIAAMLPRLPEDRAGERRPLDLPGAAAATLGIGCLVLALAEGGAWRGTSWIGGLLAAAVLLLMLFAGIERSSANPLLPPGLLARSSFAGACLAAFLFGSVIGLSIFLLTLCMQQSMGFDPMRAAAAFLPQELTVVVMANLVGRLVTRFGTRAVLLAGAAAFALGALRLSHLAAENAWSAYILPGTILIGIGIGCVLVASSVTMTSGLAREDQGAAAGLWNVAPQIGASVNTAILAAAADAFSRGRLLAAPQSAEALAGYRSAFTALLAWTVLISLGVWLLLRRSDAEARRLPAESAARDGKGG
ncbi:MAG: hypothetical protein A9Z00_09620 [Thermobacillus sp. ZCTH02-B1]|uniref:MFS transporter n=1 Tax=Thermobacillus sp. ZCTH02-B1 TaxID=1858795 RepID=UPI000B56CCC7|nr:MFS transporter [Thermobacillus sp. ZCTH02-B1]OUM97520.1 MAG: hypothetical protein A9Z00_09620 [Thermobacillus sp. ZCTH02-B1]